MLEKCELGISSSVHRHCEVSISKTKHFISLPQQLRVLQSHQETSSSSQHPIKIFLCPLCSQIQWSSLILTLNPFWKPLILSILSVPIPGFHLDKHKRTNWSSWFDLCSCSPHVVRDSSFLKHKSVTWGNQQPFYVSWWEHCHHPCWCQSDGNWAGASHSIGRSVAGNTTGGGTQRDTPWLQSEHPDCGA